MLAADVGLFNKGISFKRNFCAWLGERPLAGSADVSVSGEQHCHHSTLCFSWETGVNSAHDLIVLTLPFATSWILWEM